MNSINIIKKSGLGIDDAKTLFDAFEGLEKHPIACCNWFKEYPYTPEVSFRVFHDGVNLYIRFDVNETDVAAVTTVDNGPVWKDSCVEFFIQPEPDGGYYNFELNCIGSLLLGYRTCKVDAQHAPKEIVESVKRFTKYPHESMDLKGFRSWWAIEVIPVSALFMHNITTWDGLECRANLFKCGDDLPNPHFLSWNPIEWATPNFHLPQFFGEISF